MVVELNEYGYRRVTRGLVRRSRPVNYRKVLRVMRERRLVCCRKRRDRATREANHNETRFPNVWREVVLVRLLVLR